MKTRIISLALGLFVFLIGHSQGFVNLNFEDATFVSDTSSGLYPYFVYSSNAIPGWTAYVGESPVSEVLSNTISLSGGAVSIIGTNYVYPPIQGKYFMLLAGVNYTGNYTTAGIGQTGTIPSWAQSLTFWGYLHSGIVSFDGQALAVTQTGSTPNYNIYSADINAYAGLSGELLFSTALRGTLTLDNIQFSSSPVPEPSAFYLSALGGLFLAWRRRKI